MGQGNTEWQYTLGHSGFASPITAKVIDDGTLLAAWFSYTRPGEQTVYGDEYGFISSYKLDGTWNSTTPLGRTEAFYGAAAVHIGSDGSLYQGGRTMQEGTLTKYSREGNQLWSLNLDLNGAIRSISTSGDSSVYVTGEFAGGNIDGQTRDGGGAYVAKYTSEGNKLWERHIESPAIAIAYSVSAAEDGSIYITGTSEGEIDGQESNGGSDAFIVKYNEDGTKQWTKALGTSSADGAYAITTSRDGFIYITGYTVGNLSGNANSGDSDAFLAKYSSDGSRQWTRVLGSSSDDTGLNLTVAEDGSIYITGETYGYLDGKNRNGVSDIFVSRYTSDGILVGTSVLGTPGGDAPYSIATGDADKVFLIGGTDFDNGGIGDVFVSRLKKIEQSSTQDLITGNPKTSERTFDLSTATSKVTGDDGIIDRFTLQTNAAPANPWRITEFNPTEDILQIPAELASRTAAKSFFGVQKVVIPDRPLTKSEQKSYKKQQKAVSKSVKRIGKTGDGFVYNQLTGELFVDTNGSKKGFGEGGGLLAVLEDTPAIGINNFQFL